MKSWLFGLVLAVAAVITAAPASAAPGVTIYGLKENGSIVVFKATPTTVGLVTQTLTPVLLNNEKLVAIAFDQRTGVLFGFGHKKNLPNNPMAMPVTGDDDTGRFYVINRLTGVATSIQAAPFTGLYDARYSFWDLVDPSFAMHIDPNNYVIKVVTWDGQALRYDLYDGQTWVEDLDPDFGEQVVASAVITDFRSGDTNSLYLAVDEDEETLELQRRDASGHIVDLVDPFFCVGVDPQNSHVGFDIHGFNGYVSYTQGDTTRLYFMDLFPWYDNGQQDDDDMSPVLPALTPIGVIGDSFSPITALAILPGAGYIATGKETGPGTVVVTSPSLNAPLATFNAWNVSVGARVAMGDFNADGFPEIVTAPGSGTNAILKIFDGESLFNAGTVVFFPPPNGPLNVIAPFGPTNQGGLFVACADLNGDGLDDIVAGTGSGTARFRVVNGATLTLNPNLVAVPGTSFNSGGARVAVGFFSNLPTPEKAGAATSPECCPQPVIIVGSGNGTSRVALYHGEDVFFEYPDFGIAHLIFIVQGFTGQVFVAAGDINDSGDRIILGRGTGTPTIAIVDVADIAVTGAAEPYNGVVTQFDYPTFNAFTGTVGGIRVGTGVIDMLAAPFTPTNYEAVILAARGPGIANSVRGFPDVVYPTPQFSALFTIAPFANSYTGGLFVAGYLGIRGCGFNP